MLCVQSWTPEDGRKDRPKHIKWYSVSLYMFRTGFPSIIRSSRLYIQHQVYVIQVLWLLLSGHEMELQFHLVTASKQSTNQYDIYLMLCVQSWTPDNGRKDRPKHVEWYSISWFYYINIWRRTVPWTSNLSETVSSSYLISSSNLKCSTRVSLWHISTAVSSALTFPCQLLFYQCSEFITYTHTVCGGVN
jgi:hypothetical protein